MTDLGESRAARDLHDAELLAKIAAGDAQAIGALYDRYASVAFGVARRILPEASDAEDAVHDAFVAMIKRASQYSRDRGTVVAWLITSVRNTALDRHRRRTRRQQILSEEAARDDAPPPSDPERKVALAQDGQRLTAALATLSEAHRETLQIAFFEGLSYPEIAERQGVPLGTVKSRAARALAALRGVLEQADADPD